MKFVIASAFALATLIGVGGASACDFHEMQSLAYTAPQPAQPVASADVKQMVMAYLEELAAKHRIA